MSRAKYDRDSVLARFADLPPGLFMRDAAELLGVSSTTLKRFLSPSAEYRAGRRVRESATETSDIRGMGNEPLPPGSPVTWGSIMPGEPYPYRLFA